MKELVNNCICSSFDDIDVSKLNIFPKTEWKKKSNYLIIKKYNDCVFKYAHNKNKYEFANASNIDFVIMNMKMTDSASEPIRLPDENEDFSRINDILKENEDIYNLRTLYNKTNLFDLFMIISMRKTYNSLKNIFPKNIPDAKFCFMLEKRLFSNPHIAMIQKYVNGITLWDLFYYNQNLFQKKKSIISKSIKIFLDSDMIDLNIKNFILSPDDILYYIDCKPTYTNTKRANEYNRKGILEYMQ